VAVASAASTVSAIVLVAVGPRHPVRIVAQACAVVGLSTVLVGFASSSTYATCACMIFGGYSAGTLQILGSSVATEAVHPEDRGQAIAHTGTVRAASMLASPLIVVVFLYAVSISMSFAAIGALLGLTSVLIRRQRLGEGLGGSA
jgi:MFS family permease